MQVGKLLLWLSILFWVQNAEIFAQQHKVQRLLQQLKHRNWKVRRNAIYQLANYKNRQVVSALLARLQDVDIDVRRTSAAVLSSMDAQNVAIWSLCQQINAPQIERRIEAASRLGNINGNRKIALAALIGALHDDIKVVCTALKSLGALGGKKAVKLLISKLQDRDRDVRLATVQALQLAADRKTVAALQVTLRDSDSKVRQAAMAALAQIPTPEALAALTQIVNDPQQYTDDRRAAVRALQETGAMRAIQALMRIASNRKRTTTIRKFIIKQMRHSPHKIVVTKLIAIMLRKNENKTIRLQAMQSLAKLKSPRAFYPLLKLLDAPDMEIRRTAISTLQELDSEHPQIWKWYGRFSTTSDSQLSPDELQAMKEKTTLAVSLLILSLRRREPRSPKIRRMSTYALGEIGGKRAETILLQTLQNKEENDYLRQTAAYALGKISNSNATNALLKVLRDCDQNQQLRCVAAEALATSPAALPALKTLVTDDSRSVRRAIATTLAKLDNDHREKWELCSKLNAEHRKIRNTAALQLGRMTKDAELLVPLLRAALHDRRFPSPRAAQALATLKTRSAIRALIAALEHNVTRQPASEALRQIGEPATEELLAALPNADRQCKGILLELLGEIGNAQAIAALMTSLQENSQALRCTAIKALGISKAAVAIPVLQPMLTSWNPDVRRAAVNALQQIDLPATMAILTNMLCDADKNVRRLAIDALTTIPDANTMAILKPAIADEAMDVRLAALLALTQVDTAHKPLWQLCAHINQEEISRKKTALHNLQRANHVHLAAPALLATLKDESEHIQIRGRVAGILAKIDSNEVIDGLIAVLGHGDRQFGNSIVRTLQMSAASNAYTRYCLRNVYIYSVADVITRNRSEKILRALGLPVPWTLEFKIAFFWLLVVVQVLITLGVDRFRQRYFSAKQNITSIKQLYLHTKYTSSDNSMGPKTWILVVLLAVINIGAFKIYVSGYWLMGIFASWGVGLGLIVWLKYGKLLDSVILQLDSNKLQNIILQRGLQEADCLLKRKKAFQYPFLQAIRSMSRLDVRKLQKFASSDKNVDMLLALMHNVEPKEQKQLLVLVYKSMLLNSRIANTRRLHTIFDYFSVADAQMGVTLLKIIRQFVIASRLHANEDNLQRVYTCLIKNDEVIAEALSTIQSFVKVNAELATEQRLRLVLPFLTHPHMQIRDNALQAAHQFLQSKFSLTHIYATHNWIKRINPVNAVEVLIASSQNAYDDKIIHEANNFALQNIAQFSAQKSQQALAYFVLGDIDRYESLALGEPVNPLRIAYQNASPYLKQQVQRIAKIKGMYTTVRYIIEDLLTEDFEALSEEELQSFTSMMIDTDNWQQIIALVPRMPIWCSIQLISAIKHCQGWQSAWWQQNIQQKPVLLSMWEDALDWLSKIERNILPVADQLPVTFQKSYWQSMDLVDRWQQFFLSVGMSPQNLRQACSRNLGRSISLYERTFIRVVLQVTGKKLDPCLGLLKTLLSLKYGTDIELEKFSSHGGEFDIEIETNG